MRKEGELMTIGILCVLRVSGSTAYEGGEEGGDCVVVVKEERRRGCMSMRGGEMGRGWWRGWWRGWVYVCYGVWWHHDLACKTW